MTSDAITPDDITSSTDGPDPEGPDAPTISSPTKLIRLASMTRALLDEVRQAPLDEAGRQRLARVHDQTLDELREMLSEELIEEFDEMFVPLRGDHLATESELRISQAQLIGWLEGLFHGIQASLVSQQMAARAQLEEVQRGQVMPSSSQNNTGLYL